MTEHDDLYRIGTVAQLTGVAVERLRAWERRHGFAPAHRTGRTRFYSAEQVERLRLIRQLIDAGHPISSVADLDLDQLTARLHNASPPASPRPASAPAPAPRNAGNRAVGLIGANLLVLEARDGADTRLDIAARWANVGAFHADQVAYPELETLIVQLPVLSGRELEDIRAVCPETRLVAVYQFATEGQIATVEDLGVPALQWPLGWPDIERACTSEAGLPLRAARSAPRKYSDEQLIAIAATLDPEDEPTPGHLVDMITNLNAFAQFSLQSAMEQGAADDLHERTHTRASEARAQLELALAGWLDDEPRSA